MTHQRIQIYQELAWADDHPDAETIFKNVRKKMPTISKDTVYRALWMFTDIGLISTLGSPKKRIQFDANVTPHHHFLCNACGSAFDFNHQDFNNLSIPEEVDEMGLVHSSHVEFKGICSHCQGKRNK